MTETTHFISPPPRTGAGAGMDEIDLDAPAAALTSMPDPAIAPETAAVPTEQRERESVRDPKLSTLQGMFPDFDESLLQSVLGSVGGNTDRAIDVLLGMSDPEYHSDARPQEQEEQPVLSQEELDARFARQLYMEDQQQAQAAWEAQQQQHRPRPAFNTGRRASQMQQEPERDTMTEIGDQFNKIAESGKRTFGNIFSKVKAKIAEFDQPRQEGSASSSYNPDASSAGYQYQGSYPTAQQHRHQRMQQQQYLLQQQHQQQQQQQQPAYYDPNATSDSPPSSPGGHEFSSGYEATPVPRAGTANVPQSTPPRSPPIDAGKLGLLPKRPVSLLRPQSPGSPPADGAPGHPKRISTELISDSPPAPAARHNSDADDLYADAEEAAAETENPFDDEYEHVHGHDGHAEQTKATTQVAESGSK
ncbi:hypothetical protein GYMLUDRAFT_35360 [Collybiopsis luxurians FD-317 M1]|nr:hypothetical protein GYMLUDRAFT_35360 [Collybiopsis luxurians FD-317 M1]